MSKKNMKNFRHRLEIVAATFALCVAPLVGSATMLDVGFTTIGSGTLGASCGLSCTDLQLTGTTSLSGLNSYFGSSSAPAFTFSALFSLTQDGPLGADALCSAPAGWTLTDGSGDSIYGWAQGWFLGTPGSSNRLGGLYFGIDGGTGLFANVSGSGGSLADLSGSGSYGQGGDFLLTAPVATSVPEPGVLSLFAAALAALAWSVRRRRGRFAAAAAGSTL